MKGKGIGTITSGEIKQIVQAHERWREECWNLIASENVMSPAVSDLLSNDFSHRYGDYEGIDLNARKYPGNQYIVQLELQSQELASLLFDAEHVDLRPISGHIAGIAPLLALCRPADGVAELSRECGGHRLAGKMEHCSLIQLRAIPIAFDPDRFNIDVQQTLDLIDRERPRLLILGSSTFLFPHPIAELRSGINTLGCSTLIQYDASHVLGLIAGKRFQQPLAEGADFVTSSTHKTLAGPQGGLLLTNSATIAEAVGRALQPGILSNHHLHRLPGLCETLLEWREQGAARADRIVEAAQALGAALERQGIAVVASHLGYTKSHTILLATKSFGPSRGLSLRLESANIMVSSCLLPGKLGPDGLRLGVQEMIRRGMLLEDVDEMAIVITKVLHQEIDPQTGKKCVATLARKMAARC